MLLEDKIIKRALGSNIKSARLNLKLTQDKLAELSDISVVFLKDIESGRSSASLSTLIYLCKALKVTPNDLLKDFFISSEIYDNNLYEQIKLLPEYEKNAIYSLISYFNKGKKESK